MNIIKFLLKNRYFSYTASLLLMQQIVVATSTIWLADVAYTASKGQDFASPLKLYILSLLLPYIPGFFALVYLEKWRQSSFSRFVEDYISMFKGRVELLGLEPLQTRCKSLLAKDGPQIISGFIDYAYSLLATTMNFTLCLATIAYVVDMSLLLSFSLSLLVSFLIIYYQSDKQRYLSDQYQNVQNHVGSIMLQSWNNIVIHNTLNFPVWHRRSIDALHQQSITAISQTKLTQYVSIGVAIITGVPSLALITYFLLGTSASKDEQIALISTLPRLFIMMMSAHSMLNNIASWPLQMGKLKFIKTIVQQTHSTKKLEERIDLSKIAFESSLHGVKTCHRLVSIYKLKEYIQDKGRHTITGSNGAGKSSILLMLKKIHGDDAFYLPTQGELAFKTSSNVGSSGQLKLQQIMEVINNGKFKYLLLDEWDANLDVTNREKINQILDDIATSYSIIEVCHRRNH